MAGVTGEGRRDNITGTAVQMDHQHFRTHRGQLYSASFYTATLAGGASLEFLCRASPQFPPPHVQVEAANGTDGRLSIFEAPTVTADGTPVPVINRNRLSTNTANMLVFEGPTTTADGTNLIDRALPGNEFQFETFNEIIFAPGTDYLVRLTNEEGGAGIASINLLFYEAFD